MLWLCILSDLINRTMFSTRQKPVSLLSSVRHLIANTTGQVQQLFTTTKFPSFSPFIYNPYSLALKPKTTSTFVPLPLLSSISTIASKKSTSRNKAGFIKTIHQSSITVINNRLLMNQVYKFKINKIICL